ncbi:MAG: hypothetical protein AB1847_17690 [bacterium]
MNQKEEQHKKVRHRRGGVKGTAKRGGVKGKHSPSGERIKKRSSIKGVGIQKW